MKKPLVLIAAIVAVVGLCAAVAVAKERIKVKTSVTLFLHSDLSGPKPDSWRGEVKARKRGCEKGRTVTVSHGSKKVGSDKTNNRGKYTIVWRRNRAGSSGALGADRGATGGHGLGGTAGRRFIAKARKMRITKSNGDKLVCEADKSKPFTLPG